MGLDRQQSADIGTSLQLVDSRLRALADAENGYAGDEDDKESAEPPMKDFGNGRTTSSSRDEQTSTFNSGLTTPWDPDSGEQTPRPDLPHMYMERTRSMIQYKKEERRKWYSNSKKGVKLTTKYFYQEVDISWTIVLIIACYFVAGLVDCLAFSVWGTFVSMQTGNTIFLAIRIAHEPIAHHPLNYVKSLVSLISYCFGTLAFNTLHRAPTSLSSPQPRLHRWTLFTSFGLQSVLITVAAILAQVGVMSNEPYRGGTFSSGTLARPGNNFLDLIGIALLAFEAAGQVCLSRILLVNELPTIVLSTAYHDLIADSLGFAKCWRESETWWDLGVSQKRQLRRLCSIIFLFSGAIVGGFVFSSRPGLALGLWIAVGVKVLICVAWCLWKKKIVTETVVTRILSRPNVKSRHTS